MTPFASLISTVAFVASGPVVGACPPAAAIVERPVMLEFANEAAPQINTHAQIADISLNIFVIRGILQDSEGKVSQNRARHDSRRRRGQVGARKTRKWFV